MPQGILETLTQPCGPVLGISGRSGAFTSQCSAALSSRSAAARYTAYASDRAATGARRQAANTRSASSNATAPGPPGAEARERPRVPASRNAASASSSAAVTTSAAAEPWIRTSNRPTPSRPGERQSSVGRARANRCPPQARPASAARQRGDDVEMRHHALARLAAVAAHEQARGPLARECGDRVTQ
jgi:hypothetical protein